MLSASNLKQCTWQHQVMLDGAGSVLDCFEHSAWVLLSITTAVDSSPTLQLHLSYAKTTTCVSFCTGQASVT